ncbi:MAG: DNA-binding CsgD family transcriptional regulator [Polaribacter sp.]|jgi:DNA-binding CsgD family transcriptional regulator
MKNPRGRPPHKDKLTPAEWRTANAVRHGLTNQEIADLEKISLDGVKYHVANPIAKLELKNRKALKHWVGSPVDSLLNTKVNSMNQEFSINGLAQVSRTVKNIVESERWYRDVLGLTHLYTFDSLAFFDCDGTRLMLSEK